MEWTLPDLGEGVQEGEILKWLAKAGDTIAMDQPLLEIMTDKATVELPAPVGGILKNIKVKPGDVVKIKSVLATIEAKGGTVVAAQNVIARSVATKQTRVFADTGSPRPVGPRDDKLVVVNREVLASPAVRQASCDRGVDLRSLLGSGPAGRILMEDLNNETLAKPLPVLKSSRTENKIPLRGLRRKISEHMSLSRKHAAHFSHVDEADLTNLVALRELLKEEAQKKEVKLTYLAFIMKAIVFALSETPNMNASLDEESQEIILKNYYDIGFAAATDEGLIVPHVKNCDQLSVFDIAREISRLAEAVKTHKATLDELKGSTFTVTNIGSIGGIMSMPIINYPEVAIMGFHKIVERPVVKNGEIVVRQMTYFSISADHRVVDGATVARFLNRVIEILQAPKLLMT